MTEPKRHHFVPRFYLRRFANEHDRVCVRSRDGRSFQTSTGNVMIRSGLYRVPSELRTVETTLSKFEAAASEAFERVDSDCFPSTRTDERRALAMFLALQFARHFDNLAVFELMHDVRDRVETLPVSLVTVRQHLTELYGFEPSDDEARAAADFVNGYFNMWPNAKINDIQEFRVKSMFDMALGTVAPLLESMFWSLEVSRQAHLVTSDRPAVLWHPESNRDLYKGIGIEDAEEIWFVLDARRMFVLRHTGIERTKRIGPERVRFVNAHIARHCTSDVLSSPSASEHLESVQLARRRPTVRFGYATLRDKSGLSDNGEVLHIWRPIRDIPDDSGDPYPS